MAYKCRVCGVNDVDNQGDMCELCAIGQDPYTQTNTVAPSFQDMSHDNTDNNRNGNSSYTPKRGEKRKLLLNGGASLANRDPYGNDMTEYDSQPSVQVYSAGQVPQASQQNISVTGTAPSAKISGEQPITTGITKNITVDNQKKSVLTKWFRALFRGIPFTLDNDVTMFQVFPDFSGTALNSLGNACDQVIVYGRINNGAVSENNDVEVYGRRDVNNNVIAKKIKNKASGTVIVPTRTLSQGVVWLITAIAVSLIVLALSLLGVEGIIWTVVIVFCLMNLPIILKILGIFFGALFSFIKHLF